MSDNNNKEGTNNIVDNDKEKLYKKLKKQVE